jgi:DNA-binding NarL/FixJ family response regulator
MIRLLVADDHPIVREGLKRIVESCVDMEVVGEAVDGEAAVAKARELEPDVVLLDLSMPGPGFTETLEALAALPRRPRILVLSAHAEETHATRSLGAGADGYLTKERSSEKLEEAIRRVHAGETFPALAGRQLPHERLSEREYQVFLALAKGEGIKQIAHQLTLSPKTVSTYRSRILEKMNLAGNAELVRYVVEHGL